MSLLFGNNVFTSDKKREEILVGFETELKRLKSDYFDALDFLESCKDIIGFVEMIKQLKDEYISALTGLDGDIKQTIKMFRKKVDKINQNQKWMNSKSSVSNMEGLNQTIGKLMAICDEIEQSKSAVNDKQSGEIASQPAGLQ